MRESINANEPLGWGKCALFIENMQCHFECRNARAFFAYKTSRNNHKRRCWRGNRSENYLFGTLWILPGDDIRMYNSLHKNCTSIADDSDGNWISEAQRTEEIFPGRPQIGPSFDFGTSSKRENSRTCRKNYTIRNAFLVSLRCNVLAVIRK